MTQKKREILCCLSHTPGLRTCPFRKDKQLEAHADMYTIYYTNTYYGKTSYNNVGMRNVYITSRGHLHCIINYGIVQVFEVWNVMMKRQ